MQEKNYKLHSIKIKRHEKHHQGIEKISQTLGESLQRTHLIRNCYSKYTKNSVCCMYVCMHMCVHADISVLVAHVQANLEMGKKI